MVNYLFIPSIYTIIPATETGLFWQLLYNIFELNLKPMFNLNIYIMKTSLIFLFTLKAMVTILKTVISSVVVISAIAIAGWY